MKTLYAEMTKDWMRRVDSIVELTTGANPGERMFTINLDARMLRASMRGAFIADTQAEPVRVDPASVTPATTLDFL